MHQGEQGLCDTVCWLEFDNPLGLDISREISRIHVADHLNGCVQCLDLDLTYNSFIESTNGALDVKLTSVDIVIRIVLS